MQPGGNRSGSAILVGLALVMACRGRPSDEELDRLHAEAVAANREAQERAPTTHEPGFTLTVSGQIEQPSATIGWTELQQLGQTHVETINPQNPGRKDPTDFRGVLVRDLLDRFGARPEATEVTAVAVDGFRATVQIADARTYRMLLAIEADGAPIPRSSGGPIFLVHPYTESSAELRWKYPDRFWSFYVTHLVVGTEEPRLKIHGRVLDRDALAKLPPATYDGHVGWKVDWPADLVHLRGVHLADAIAAAGLTLPPDGHVIVRGKSPLHRDPTKPIAIAVTDLERCKPLLAMQWGSDEKPITAQLGGPIALAIPPCGEAYNERAWVTFVEEIEVVPR